MELAGVRYWVREREATQQTSELLVRSFTYQESRRKTGHFWTYW